MNEPALPGVVEAASDRDARVEGAFESIDHRAGDQLVEPVAGYALEKDPELAGDLLDVEGRDDVRVGRQVDSDLGLAQEALPDLARGQEVPARALRETGLLFGPIAASLDPLEAAAERIAARDLDRRPADAGRMARALDDIVC